MSCVSFRERIITFTFLFNLPPRLVSTPTEINKIVFRLVRTAAEEEASCYCKYLCNELCFVSRKDYNFFTSFFNLPPRLVSTPTEINKIILNSQNSIWVLFLQDCGLFLHIYRKRILH